VRTRAFLVLALLCAGLPCAARDASWKLAALVYPNDCRPALTIPGAAIDVLVRGAEGESEISGALFRREAQYPLSLRAAGTQEPDGAKWFRATVPKEAQAGAYSLEVQLRGRADRNSRSVFVFDKVPTEYAVAQVTDTHVGSWARSAAPMLEAVTEQVNQAKPLLVLITGDITDGGKAEEYQTFLRMLNRFEAPTFVCAGNHDRHSRTLDSVYVDYCGEPSYFFDVGQDRFVACDMEFRWTDWQRHPQWLGVADALRGSSSTRWRIVFSHRYEPGMSYHFQRYLCESRVSAFLSGHWHWDFVGQFSGGTKWVATAASVGGCWRMFSIGRGGVTVGPLQGPATAEARGTP
jgi:hypothetical protein